MAWLDAALANRSVVFPPIVVCELLSAPGLKADIRDDILAIPMLELTPGFFVRAGLLRAKVIARGFKARLADTLVAQSCIDHDVPLATHDRDFRHFVRLGGLRLFSGFPRTAR